jgi:ADP-heptose:LPS heptosyltransferase
MHLAAAVGTPVVALFGPTTREWGFYPSGPCDTVLEQDLDCRPCSLHGTSRCQRRGQCLEAVSPADVLKAIELRPQTE